MVDDGMILLLRTSCVLSSTRPKFDVSTMHPPHSRVEPKLLCTMQTWPAVVRWRKTFATLLDTGPPLQPSLNVGCVKDGDFRAETAANAA